ncbi:filamentous hemagglutinin family protein [Orrella sp. JC864]|uniref:filamentous haemagglutinin family protein n=1 Tax=Orrella sp. JC864 TaxID=3120298 RepID=UPI003009D2BF
MAIALAAAGAGLGADAQAASRAGGAWFAVPGGKSQLARQPGAMQARPHALSRGQQMERANLQRAMDSVNRAAATIAARQAEQAAAREQALAAPSDIPDGLAEGGLQADADAGWLNAKAPTQRRHGQHTEVTIEQTGQKAILNWKTFNVSRDTTVRFDQSAGNDAKDGNTWSVLNRVNDPSGRPSRIAGQIQAEGSVYVINRNGVIFHGSSQVNTRNLLAASLKLTDEQFLRGINNPARIDGGAGNDVIIPQLGEFPDSLNFFVGEPHDPGPVPGDVTVQAGARLQAHGAGKIMLFGPKVSNAGTISAPDGQVILAAGENVYLKSPNDGELHAVRGLDVAVAAPAPRAFTYNHFNDAFARDGNISFKQKMQDEILPAMRERAAQVGYAVVNDGVVTAERGNITLQSMDVNQRGVLLSTTALNNRNGSITLRAWGQGFYAYSEGQGVQEMLGWDAGMLTLAPGSVARILPDPDDTGEIELAALATRYDPGRVSLYGKIVNVQRDASVWAPAGDIDVRSASLPLEIQQDYRAAFVLAEPDGNRIYLDSGAFLGVGGLQDVLVPTERNFVQAEFRINELRDSPLNRNGWLRGQKLVIDRRKAGVFAGGPMSGVQWVTGEDGEIVPGAWVGTRLGDMTGWVGVGKTDLQELSTQGGTITLVSKNGDVITRPGAFMDVSGGSVRYTGGYDRSTMLRAASGRIYNIGSAPENEIYVGVAGQYVRESARWGVTEAWYSPLLGRRRYERGYAEGRGAGAIEIKAGRNIVLEGDVWGGVSAGERQAAQQAPHVGGRLTVGASSVADTTWSLGRLFIGSAPRLLPGDFAVDSPELPDWFRYLSASETGQPSDGRLKQTWLSDEVLSASGLGEINLWVTDDSAIEAGAWVELSPGASLTLGRVEGSEPAIEVAGTVRAPGGSIILESGKPLTLAATGRLDVAGQWLGVHQEGSAPRAPAIHGGSVSINRNLPQGLLRIEKGALIDVSGGGQVYRDGARTALRAGDAGSIRLGGLRLDSGLENLDLRAYAAGSGGELDLVAAADVQIGGTLAQDAGDVLHLPATLYADRGFRSLVVDTRGHRITVPQNVTARQDVHVVNLLPQDYADAPAGAPLPPPGRIGPAPAHERLAREPGGLWLYGQDVRIETGAILATDLGGTLRVSGDGTAGMQGQVNVHGTLQAPAGRIEIDVQSLTLHPGAELLARGVPVIELDGARGRQGSVLAGGQVTLQAESLNLAQGALVDVSGASGWIDVPAGGGFGRQGRLQAVRVDSDGGRIEIRGLGIVESRLRAEAGGPGAVGGALAIGYAAPAPSGGGANPANQILDLLKQLDPDCSGVGDWSKCTWAFDDPYKAVGWDINLLVGWGTPIILSREFVDLVVAHAASQGTAGFFLSDSRPAPAASKPLNPADYGISDTVLDLFRDYHFGSDVMRDVFTPPRDASLVVRASAFGQGGMADLALQGAPTVPIQIDPIVLALGRSISLEGPITSAGDGTVMLRAPYIALASGLEPGQQAELAGAQAGLAGQLSLQAAVIQLGSNGLGTAARIGGDGRISGFARTLLQADDVRLAAGLAVDGELLVRAGQVYPMTLARPTIRAADAIRIEQLDGAPAAMPLSAGGSLRLQAPVIEQDGTLRAPAGQIELAATQRLSLGADSLTSVASTWMVPYGKLSNGEYWLDPALEGPGASDNPADRQMAAPPEKRITLDAPQVAVTEGALVDISGGGDLHAWEFVPGPGGSHDLLTRPGMYAILPGYQGLSPGDPDLIGSSAAIPDKGPAEAGRQVWLSGGEGLAPGWYTLLPARYALLPGAYAVQDSGQGRRHVAAGAGGAAGARLGDGSLLMQGRAGNAADGSSQSFGSLWRVLPGSVVRSYTEYNEASANAFFSSDAFKLTQYRLSGQNVVTPRLPRDGGAVVFKAGERLLLDGSLRSQAAAGGLGGLVDIAGEKIAIVGAGREAEALRADGYLVVDAAKLSGFGAGSLLVGGTRSGDPQGMRVDVTATHIVVRNDAGSVLAGPEIILAAGEELSIEAGSRIAVQEGSGASVGDLIMAPRQKAVYTDPDGNLDDNWDGVIDEQDAADDVLTTPAADWGALVRISNGAPSRVVREGVDTSRGGRVSVGADAQLAGGAALLIDATRTTDLAASALLSGADLSVASGRIGFGGGSQGMVLDQAALAQLARSNQLTLRSYSSFDFHDSVDLSAAGLQSVVLDGARLAGLGADVRVRADTLTLQNLSGIEGGAQPDAGQGALSLQARRLVLGAGEKAIHGFADVMLQASDEIVGAGRGGLDAGGSQVTVAAPLLTGRGGASQSLSTLGRLQVLASHDAQAPAEALADSLGASLSLSGGSIDFGGHAAMLGGTVSLTATAGDLVLAETARIDVGGLARTMFDQTEYADAGRVNLSSLGGDVRVLAGSVVNLAAMAGGGDAGQLSVTAGNGGAVALLGTLDAQAGAGGRAGAFTLDIDTLPDFGALAARLDQAGFSRARHFRVREGDVLIDGATTVQDFALTADRGKVSIHGVVDARAPYGGSIRITGGAGIVVGGQAQLLAGATGELGSGRVTLEAAGGRLQAPAGLIDVDGGQQGVVRLRAARTADNGEVAADAIGVQVRGARLAVLEGTRIYDNASVDAVKAQAVAEAQDFAARGAAIAARVGGGWAVMPGIEIRSGGDLSMASDWNLWTDFAGARAGSLTLRAAGKLDLAGHLSDGFDTAGRDGLLQAGESWNLRLVAGADLGSADALALRPQALLGADQGTITVGVADSSKDAGDGAGHLVRTGTGDIAVRAGRDLLLAHADSALYTAGRRDTTVWSDFTTAAPGAVYGVHGGHLDVGAQGSIRAEHSGRRFVEWLQRQGNVNADGYFGPYSTGYTQEPAEQSSWWVAHGGFGQGLGVLGGGNLTVEAGGDLDNLVVALATNMRMRGGRSADEAMRMEVRNGGTMAVQAAGAIRGGQYYLARGQGRIAAGMTDIGHRVAVSKSYQPAREFDIAPVFALGDAELAVRTTGELRVQAIIDPLMVRLGYDGRTPGPGGSTDLGAYMSGYTDRTSLALTSVGGNVTLVNQADFVFRDVALQTSTTEFDALVGKGGNLFPPQLRAAALSGSLEIQGPMYVVPSARHDMRLLAHQDVRFNTRQAESLHALVGDNQRPMPVAEIIMSRAVPGMMPSPYLPFGGSGYDQQIHMDAALRNEPGAYMSPSFYSTAYFLRVGNPQVLPLAGDHEPSRIYAGSGSITGLNLYASEQTWVRTGGDIRSFNVQARNLRPSDTTLLEAGNDIVAMQPVYGRTVGNGVAVQGPGLLMLSAGRDVYAGSLGVTTLGNQRYDDNNRPVPLSQVLGLPEQGAAITVMAGMNRAPAYEAFADAYLNPQRVASMPGYLTQPVQGDVLPVYLTDAVQGRPDGQDKTVRRGLVSYVAQVTGQELAPLQAWERFKQLPEPARQQFLRRVFLQELRDAGRDQNLPGTGGLPKNGGYNRGYAAIETLFPGQGWQGGVAATSLTLRTQAGGDIQVLTPGGGLQVAALGATVAPGAGLVTLDSGHINVFARDSVTVNRSRILSFVPQATGQGSDQIIWSSRGDIDAGRGAKTVRVPSAPDIVTDEDGHTRILERSDMSGSGIGTVGQGDVDLVAPEGTVNFGDAGVRVAGNFNVAALQVLNAANIEVQGEVTGLPEVAAVNTGALTSASSAAAAAADSAQDVIARQRSESRRNLPSIISVQILGFGEETPQHGASAAPPPGQQAHLRYDRASPLQVVGKGDAVYPQQAGLLTAAQRQRMRQPQ